MICPKCKTDLRCPCKSCQRTNPPHLIVWGWEDNGEIMYCPICDHRNHADAWEEI